jgi:hypothetical protein
MSEQFRLIVAALPLYLFAASGALHAANQYPNVQGTSISQFLRSHTRPTVTPAKG